MMGETKVLRAGMQSALRLLFPPQCIGCGAPVASDFGLCPDCWRETPFIAGLVCNRCGTPLPGAEGAEPAICDDCMTIARPWQQGRAALLYRDMGRKLVLALKHGDRLELARPMGQWLLRAARPMLVPDMLVVPVPLHWHRLFRRRYNQSALLSRQLAREAALDHCPDLLRRTRRTGTQDDRDRNGRFLNMAGAIAVHPGRRARLAGRPVLIVDDVMTSGATLAVAAEACHAAGAGQVSVLALARVAKDA